MATADLPELLDELTDGTGDGCVSVERTRLDGVADHVTIHANHAELIRAPLLFPDPGPVACMPYVLRWLKEDRERNGRAGGEVKSGEKSLVFVELEFAQRTRTAAWSAN